MVGLSRKALLNHIQVTAHDHALWAPRNNRKTQAHAGRGQRHLRWHSREREREAAADGAGVVYLYLGNSMTGSESNALPIVASDASNRRH